jgi:hypothetical protein
MLRSTQWTSTKARLNMSTSCPVHPIFSRSLFIDASGPYKDLDSVSQSVSQHSKLARRTVTKCRCCYNGLQESECLVAVSVKQERQCTYKGTLKRVRVTFVAVEEQ